MTRRHAATVVDIAALMGVRPVTVQKWIQKHDVKPTGRRWKAKLYDPNEFVRLGYDPDRTRSLRKGWRLD